LSATAGARPLGFAKFLSWTMLLVILGSSLFLSIIIANLARESILDKQQRFALLLAENLNHQIYRRFTLPTLLGYGRIALKDPVQYERLGQVVDSTIHGLHVKELRIYDFDHIVSFALDKELVGQEGLAGATVLRALNGGKHSFEIISKVSPLGAMFQLSTKPGDVVLKTTFPLRTEQSLAFGEEGETIMGVLEFIQDITEDYHAVVRFQWVIIGATFASSLLLFLVMLMIIRRAERNQVERLAERERLERELHQSEKLASMGRTVAGIAHEIRNPLGIICSSAELLLQKIPADPEKSTRILQAIHDESKRLSRTVNEFLDYARPRPPALAVIDASNVLDQVLTFLEGECSGKQVTVDKRYVAGLKIKGDNDLLYRAFYNVLVNSIQAMPQGGTLTIESGRSDRRVAIVFRDTGPGFDQQTLSQITDPFFTTKDHGTGLGLAIVDNIVKSHQGTLELADAPEGGALVRILFPAA
jgi:two-component system, NtrC family, sensor histidine kinase HydH